MSTIASEPDATSAGRFEFTIDWVQVPDEPPMRSLSDQIRSLRHEIPLRRAVAEMYAADEAQSDAEAWGEEIANTPGIPTENDSASEPESTYSPEPGLYTDLVAVLDRVGQERAWFAEGAIEGNPIAMLVGPEKKGKSWIAMQLAVATIIGGKWLEWFQIKRTGQVLYLDGEYGDDEFTRRIARIARGMGADPRDVLAQIRYHYSAGIVLTPNDTGLKKLTLDARRCRPGLIVLDPLRNHLEGSENDTDTVVKAYRSLDPLRLAAESPLFMLHHVNKGGSFSGSRALTSRADLIFEGTDTDTPTYSTRGRKLRSKDPIGEDFEVTITHTDDENDLIAATRVIHAVASRATPSGKEKAKAGATADQIAKVRTAVEAEAAENGSFLVFGKVKERAETMGCGVKASAYVPAMKALTAQGILTQRLTDDGKPNGWNYVG
jgi:hypothetical protein